MARDPSAEPRGLVGVEQGGEVEPSGSRRFGHGCVPRSHLLVGCRASVDQLVKLLERHMGYQKTELMLKRIDASGVLSSCETLATKSR